MNIEAAANPVDSGSDSVQPSDALDNLDNLDFRESEEDEQTTNEAADTGTETNGETDEAQQGQEAETETAEASDENEQTEPEPKGKVPADDVIIAMPDGQKLELKELKSGYMRDGDYRRKTQELATKRRGLEEMSTRVTNTVNAISELLMQQVPPAPDHAMSMSDPVRYMQEKALHDASMARVNAIVEQANNAKTVTNTLTQAKTTEEVQAEISKLGEAFPQIKTTEGQKKFFEGAIGAGRELGFTDADLNAVTDHRHFSVLHYASLGLAAEKAKQVAKAKVKDVPPVTPPQKRSSGQSAQNARANQEAMKRLARTGSINDAMSIDFD